MRHGRMRAEDSGEGVVALSNSFSTTTKKAVARFPFVSYRFIAQYKAICAHLMVSCVYVYI